MAKNIELLKERLILCEMLDKCIGCKKLPLTVKMADRNKWCRENCKHALDIINQGNRVLYLTKNTKKKNLTYPELPEDLIPKKPKNKKKKEEMI